MSNLFENRDEVTKRANRLKRLVVLLKLPTSAAQ
jgi:hypothetical protein